MIVATLCFLTFLLRFANSQTTTKFDPINFNEPPSPHTLRETSAPAAVTTTTVFDPHAGHNHPTWVPPTSTESIVAVTTTAPETTIGTSKTTMETTGTRSGTTTVETYQKVATINTSARLFCQSLVFLFLFFSINF